MTVEIFPAGPGRLEDLTVLLGPSNPATPACWCLTYRLTNAENRALRGTERPERLRALCHEDPPPGMIARVDGEPAGWCSFGPRSSFHRLVASRTIPVVDDLPVWSVTCFVVRSRFRRQGLAHAMLREVVEYARSRDDVPALEGYPIADTGRRISSTFAYVGTESLFAAAGFDRAATTSARSGGIERIVMRRRLRA